MNEEELREIFKKIDLHYNTRYSENKEMMAEWFRYLKKYDSKEVFDSLEYYLKYYPTNPPKMYNLINGLMSLEQKQQLKNLHTICPYCKKTVSMEDYDKHYGRCLDINFIERNVKKYCNQQIVRDDYYKMSDKDLKLRFDKIAKIVIEKTPNELEKKYLKKYFYNS